MDGQRRLGDGLGVATPAIFLDHRHGPARKPNRLRLPPHRENRGVPQAVFRGKPIVGQQRRMRHVAIVAGGRPGVAAMLPRGVLGRHHMAVHAVFWNVKEVGRRPRDVHHEKSKSGRCAQGQKANRPPARCEKPQSDDIAQPGHITGALGPSWRPHCPPLWPADGGCQAHGAWMTSGCLADRQPVW